MSKYALIAEPDTRLAQIIGGLIKDEGLGPVAVRDGDKVQSILQERGAPSLFITNLTLPRIDGFALLRELRKIASPVQSPAIAVSASMDLRTEAWNLKEKLGITALIASRMSVDSIRGVIRRALLLGPTPPPLAMAPAPTAPVVPFAKEVSPASRPVPHLDPSRLARILELGIVDDAPPEQDLQRLVQETAETFGVPIALVSIVLQDRQWFKAHFGLSGQLLTDRGTPIHQAFCRHVVDADVPQPLVIPDAKAHPLFSRNDFVMNGSVGSYAGAPLVTSTGDVLGTLCIVDTKPLSINAEQVDLLSAVARRITGELELRSKARSSMAEATRLRQLLESEQARNRAIYTVLSYIEAVLSNIDTGVILMDTERRIIYANESLASICGLTQADIVAMTRDEFADHIASLSDNPEDLRRRSHVMPAGPFVAREQFELSRPVRRILRWVAKPVQLPSGVAQLGLYTDVTAQHDAEESLDSARLG